MGLCLSCGSICKIKQWVLHCFPCFKVWALTNGISFPSRLKSFLFCCSDWMEVGGGKELQRGRWLSFYRISLWNKGGRINIAEWSFTAFKRKGTNDQRLCVFGLWRSCYDVFLLFFAFLCVLLLHHSPLNCLNYSPIQTDSFSLFTSQYSLLGSFWMAKDYLLCMHLLWWNTRANFLKQDLSELDSI